jgi:hypothetical protein
LELSHEWVLCAVFRYQPCDRMLEQRNSLCMLTSIAQGGSKLGCSD